MNLWGAFAFERSEIFSWLPFHWLVFPFLVIIFGPLCVCGRSRFVFVVCSPGCVKYPWKSITRSRKRLSVHLENQLLYVCVCGAHFFPRRSDCGYAWGLYMIPLFGDGKHRRAAALAEAAFPVRWCAFAAAFIFRPIHTAAVSTSRLHKAIKVEKNQSHMQAKWERERDGFRFLHCSLFIHLQTCKWDFGKYMHAEGPFVCFAGWLAGWFGSDSQDNDIRQQQQLYSNCSRAIIFNRRIQQTSPLVALAARHTHSTSESTHGSSSSFLSIW